jgi:ketosteroid isomerase-like protein
MHMSRRSLMAAGAAVAACSMIQTAPAMGQSADEAAVAKAVEALRTAMLAADKDKLLELVSDQLSYGHSAGKLETKAQFVDVVASKKTIYKTLTFADQSIAVAGTMAIVRNVLTTDVEVEGKPSSAKAGVMQVWTKTGTDWKLYARQAFKL